MTGLLFSGGFVYILAAEETASGMDWYQGTADAVRKQLTHLDVTWSGRCWPRAACCRIRSSANR